MGRSFPMPQLYKRFDPASWESEVCADLAPVLRLLLTDPDNRIAAMGLEDIKSPDLAVLLGRIPSGEQLEQIERICSADPNLRVNVGSVACLLHRSSLDWETELPAQPWPKASFLQRLFRKPNTR